MTAREAAEARLLQVALGLPESVQRVLAGRPLVVDFMADWCVPCKEFDVRVFSRPDVAREMRRFTLLRVDLSKGDDDPQIAAIKKKYQADTLPAVRIVTADGAILARTDELVPADRFREKLLAALPAN